MANVALVLSGQYVQYVSSLRTTATCTGTSDGTVMILDDHNNLIPYNYFLQTRGPGRCSCSWRRWWPAERP